MFPDVSEKVTWKCHGERKKGQAIGCREEEGEKGDPTIINPASSREASEQFKRSDVLSSMDVLANCSHPNHG